MGSRANVFVMDGTPTSGVYLYTHNGGYDLPSVVQAALRRARNCWDDAQYLTRVIFCEMVREDVEGTGGYGISARIGDNSYPIIVVDTSSGMIGFATEPGMRESPQPYPEKKLTFEEFINASIEDLKAVGWR